MPVYYVVFVACTPWNLSKFISYRICVTPLNSINFKNYIKIFGREKHLCNKNIENNGIIELELL